MSEKSTSASAAESTVKSFFGGITATLGVFVALIILLVLCCCGCLALSAIGSLGSSNRIIIQEEPTKIFNTAEKIEIDGVALTVNSVSNYVPESTFSRAKAGYKLVVVDVTVENLNASASGYANPYNFEVKDSEGFKYSHDIFGKEPYLSSDTIAKSEVIRGFLTFEVKEESKGLKLYYNKSWGFGKDVVVDLGM